MSLLLLFMKHQNEALSLTLLFLNSLSHWASNYALFLYAHRIWIASADAGARNHNIYVEHLSNLNEKDKHSNFVHSKLDKPLVIWFRRAYFTTFTVFIVVFGILG